MQRPHEALNRCGVRNDGHAGPELVDLADQQLDIVARDEGVYRKAVAVAANHIQTTGPNGPGRAEDGKRSGQDGDQGYDTTGS